MKQVAVKTNIMCSSCIAKVKPVLDEEFGEDNWQVDTLSAEKILKVSGDSIKQSEVINAVERAGYHAKELDQNN